MEKIILNTRPEENSDEFDRILKENNFSVINFPLIEIVPVKDFAETDYRLNRINEYDGLIFTSGNAVRIFLGRAKEKSIRITSKMFAVGEKTKTKIEDFGYACETIPEKTDSRGLADLIRIKTGEEKRYLFPKGNIGMNRIPEFLPNVDEIVVYDTVMPRNPTGIDNLKNMLSNNKVRCMVFFSPSAVKNFFVLFPDYTQRDTAVAVIGKTTKKRAESAGLRVDIMPGKYLSEELANEIIKYFNE